MATLNIDEIMKVLPHRYPILLVDKITECDDEKHIVGVKNVSINEPFFQGHFPSMPIMPGVLQLEAMAQTAGILLMRVGDLGGRIPYFLSIDKAKFRRPVRPGDQLVIDVVFTKLKSKIAKFRGTCTVDGEAVSEAEMMCMITDGQVDA